MKVNLVREREINLPSKHVYSIVNPCKQMERGVQLSYIDIPPSQHLRIISWCDTYVSGSGAEQSTSRVCQNLGLNSRG
jgi:hypothetical protein